MGKKPTLSEILTEFQAVRTKTAEEAPLASMPLQQPIAPQPQMVCDESGCVPLGGEENTPLDYEEESNSSDLVEAAARVKENQDEAVAAAEDLRDMADEFIEENTDTIAKEAALFGHIFAKSAMQTIGSGERDEYFVDQLYKTAEDAYHVAMCKMAEDEAYDIADQQVAEEDDDEIPEWLQDALQDTTSTLSKQVDTLNSIVKAKEENAGTEAQLAEAAQQAYQAANEQLPPNGGEVSPEDMQAASQEAYQAADQALAPQQQQPELTPEMLQAISQQAYQAAQPQQQQPVYPQTMMQ